MSDIAEITTSQAKVLLKDVLDIKAQLKKAEELLAQSNDPLESEKSNPEESQSEQPQSDLQNSSE